MPANPVEDLLLARGEARRLGGRFGTAGGQGHRWGAAGPGAGRFFEDTPIVPFDKWYALQAKRIRYFKKPKQEAGEGDP